METTMSHDSPPKRSPMINEGVGLLFRFAPEVLEELREEFPEIRQDLEPGGIAGPADPAVISKARSCLRILRETGKLCNVGIAMAEKRLAGQRRLAVVGTMIAAIASASVVVSLSASYKPVALCSGILSLLGSLAVLLSDHIGSATKGGPSLPDTYRGLVQIRADSVLLRSDIQSQLAIGETEDHESELSELIEKSNSLFRRTHELLTALGVAAVVH